MTPFARAIAAVKSGERSIAEATIELIGLLTDAELLWVLDGDIGFWRGGLDIVRHGYGRTPFEAGRIDRVGIPGIRFTDGPRGVAVGHSTAFPVAVARAASWDVDQERAIGAAMGAEARAHGANLFAGICVNLTYAPGWGRSQESYGEEPLILGAMGRALMEGARPFVMTCVKHFAVNSMEDARFIVDVQVDEDVLHEVFLPHFRAIADAGVDAVMSAYNAVNGEWAGQNRYLLTDVLRTQWKFGGFVMTDFVWGLRDPVGSLVAGQDLEMPFRQQRATALPKALANGRISRQDVETAARRILGTQLEYAVRAREVPPSSVIACVAHRALARAAAVNGAVLLRNECDGVPLLPLDCKALGNVALIGALADAANLGDHGSSNVHPPSTVSIADGLREVLGKRVARPENDTLAACLSAAKRADAAIVVVGLTASDEGEAMVAMDPDAVALIGGLLHWRPAARLFSHLLNKRTTASGGDRADLHLRQRDVALIDAVAAVQKKTVVVVIGGGTIMLDSWDRNVGAVLLAWYPGMEGGRAIADILVGSSAPGGRLPFAIPQRREHLPVIAWSARKVRYERWWGQRMLDRDGHAAAYPFGFGLSYTRFSIDALALGAIGGDAFEAEVSVTNHGPRDGRHVIQIYARELQGTRTIRSLVGFRTVTLAAGTTGTFTVECALQPLKKWNGRNLALVCDHWIVEASSYAGDPDALTATLALADRGCSRGG